ncbi:MAG TPA: thiamine phosphate synthase [Geothrix sp.]|jgi:thiamine monophosphate synthase|nr:thiamine phosphate synthase [Geothrix sp.]
MILLAITPGAGFDRHRWAEVLHSGVDAFLIRENQLGTRTLLEAAAWCQDTAPHVALWVAGRLDVALAAGCGLHAPEAYPEVPPDLVSLSRPLHVETQWEARKGCGQLLVSPVFDSPGKGEPWGAARLHRFLDSQPPAGPRLLALGGLEPANAGLLRHPRLAGLAAIRPFWMGDPRRAVAAFRTAE